MKKLNLLLVVVLLASSLLTAASATKLVRLEVYNKSGETVYMKLEGEHTDSFYYLTIPDDTDKTFTIMSDVYKRTTWSCEGLKNTGKLIVTGNIRLVFVECYTIPLRTGWFASGDFLWTDVDGDGLVDINHTEIAPILIWARGPNQGEPTLEKVSRYDYYTGAFWTLSCGLWSIVKVKVKIPSGCFFRYRY
jgi:hypothetical protein